LAEEQQTEGTDYRITWPREIAARERRSLRNATKTVIPAKPRKRREPGPMPLHRREDRDANTRG
jgi:hypothetical protein